MEPDNLWVQRHQAFRREPKDRRPCTRVFQRGGGHFRRSALGFHSSYFRASLYWRLEALQHHLRFIMVNYKVFMNSVIINKSLNIMEGHLLSKLTCF